jgi:hypothetical protein
MPKMTQIFQVKITIIQKNNYTKSMQQIHTANRFFKNLMIFNIYNKILQILFKL